MITDPETAERVSALMVEFSRKLDESVGAVQRACPEEEFRRYRRAVGGILGAILLDVINPLYALHPNLKPPGLE